MAAAASLTLHHLDPAAAQRFRFFHWLQPSAAGSVHISIGPAAVKQSKPEASLSRVCLRAIAAAPGNTIVYCVRFFSPFLVLRIDVSLACLLFILGGGVVLLLSLPQTCREILLVPGGKLPTAPRRTAPPGWLLLSLKERGERKNKRGAFSFQLSTPPMQQNEGVYISPLLAASTNHVAFYSSIITGFEGRKKRNKTFHVFCRSGCVSRMFRVFGGLTM